MPHFVRRCFVADSTAPTVARDAAMPPKAEEDAVDAHVVRREGGDEPNKPRLVHVPMREVRIADGHVDAESGDGEETTDERIEPSTRAQPHDAPRGAGCRGRRRRVGKSATPRATGQAAPRPRPSRQAARPRPQPE